MVKLKVTFGGGFGIVGTTTERDLSGGGGGDDFVLNELAGRC